MVSSSPRVMAHTTTPQLADSGPLAPERVFPPLPRGPFIFAVKGYTWRCCQAAIEEQQAAELVRRQQLQQRPRQQCGEHVGEHTSLAAVGRETNCS